MAASPATAEPPARQPGSAARRDWQDIRAFLLKLAVVALAAWALLGWVFGLTVMKGEDMYPRLRDGDLLLYYRLQKEYRIGDVVTFARDGTRHTARIVAQGGDTVDITEEGALLVNGSAQSEEIFCLTQPAEEGIELPCTLPEDSFFLLGDFRTQATDSRSYGPVPREELDGKVITVVRRRSI